MYAIFTGRLGVGVGPWESMDVDDLELGVLGTDGIEDGERCWGCTYSLRITCIRLKEGDSISTTGFRLRGVIGIGELFAMTDNGSGLESGGALKDGAAVTFATGVFTGLAGGGGRGCIATFISRVFCSRNVLKNALDSSGR